MPFVSIDGSIGCGKTTVIKKLKSLGISVAEEPVHEWTEWLEKYYKNNERWGFSFQMKVIIGQTKILNDIQQEQTLIMERSPQTVYYVFASMLKDKNIIEARKIIGNKIIGITCHNSIKLAKTAIKNKANYLAFGTFYPTKTKKTKYKATTKILNKAKKLTKTPLVAIGGINCNNYKKLLLNNANFLAISGYVWNNKKYKPQEAIKKLK